MLIIKKAWFPSGVLGIGPIILCRPDEKLDDWAINYWTIIWKQQIELLIIGWLIWILIEKMIRLIRANHEELIFFQEAKDYQSNLAYTLFRPWWAWTKYL